MSFAHSANAHGVRHDLIKHLRAVADYAADFAAPFNASQLAHYLGLWHDLGKFHPDFQQYLLEAEQGKRSRGPDHKAAGVRIAMEHQLGPIALLLQGHHGGLTDKTDLQRWYERCKSETDRALVRARQAVEFEASEPLRPPAFAQDTPRTAEFFLRMLFSTLVDADFLDTEAHFAPQQSERRSSDIGISTLWQRFEEDHRRRFGTIPTSSLSQVNRSRRDIYHACLDAATQPAGLFRLTVPTGGGKTRSGMAFALRYALEHGQRRVVVAVPFITITQQTADEYHSIFTSSDDTCPAVLEHHSGATERTDEADEFDVRIETWTAACSPAWLLCSTQVPT